MSEDIMPQVIVYPECSECGVAFVLRRCFSFGEGDITERWLWQRDCKHKKSEPKTVDQRSSV